MGELEFHRAGAAIKFGRREKDNDRNFGTYQVIMERREYARLPCKYDGGKVDLMAWFEN